jgi:hypothetical protein
MRDVAGVHDASWVAVHSVDQIDRLLDSARDIGICVRLKGYLGIADLDEQCRPWRLDSSARCQERDLPAQAQRPIRRTVYPDERKALKGLTA